MVNLPTEELFLLIIFYNYQYYLSRYHLGWPYPYNSPSPYVLRCLDTTVGSAILATHQVRPSRSSCVWSSTNHVLYVQDRPLLLKRQRPQEWPIGTPRGLVLGEGEQQRGGMVNLAWRIWARGSVSHQYRHCILGGLALAEPNTATCLCVRVTKSGPG